MNERSFGNREIEVEQSQDKLQTELAKLYLEHDNERLPYKKGQVAKLIKAVEDRLSELKRRQRFLR